MESHNFWHFYCKFHKYINDAESLQRLNEIPIKTLKMLMARRTFNRNLLSDDYTKDRPVIDPRWSDFKSKRNRWVLTFQALNIARIFSPSSFQVQSPPSFLRPDRNSELDECPVPFESCLVSSYQLATRHIYVDLTKYGLTAEFLKEFKPTIVVTEYYTNRSDCSCRYTLGTAIVQSDE